MEGMRGAQGRVAGIQMRQDFNARFQAWEGRHTASQDEFQTWYGDFVSESLNTDDEDELRALLPHVETMTSEAYDAYSRIRNARAMEDSITTHVGVSSLTIDEAFNQALGQEHGASFDLLWMDLVDQRQAALATGIPPSRYDETLFNTIITKAIEHEDPALLELLDRTLPGETVPLSQHPEFLDDRLQVEGRVARAIVAREEEAYQAQLERDQEREDAIVREVSRTLSENPTIQIDAAILEEWSIYDPLARQRLESLRTTFVNVHEREDPQALLEVELEIMQGAGRQRIMDLAGPGGPIRNARTLARLMDRVNQREEFGRQVLQVESYRRYRDLLLSRLGARRDRFDLEQPRTEMTEEYVAAMRDLETAAMEWFRDNPNASLVEQHRAMDEIGRFVLRRIEGDPQAIDDPDYRSQEDYLEALGDQERQAPSLDDLGAAPRADRLSVTPGHGAPDREAPTAETRRVLESLQLN
jgi:protein-tyrosine-phosphatase